MKKKLSNNKNIYTKSIPLILAETISSKSSNLLDDKAMFNKLTPITQDLLRYWFSDEFVSTREINFNSGQKKAILNAIYLFEIEKIQNISSIYKSFDIKDEYKYKIESANEKAKKDYEKETDTYKKNNVLTQIDVKQEIKNYDDLISNISQDDTHNYKKLCFKMATSSGKTWVMSALIIWQYLNAQKGYEGYIKNFLIVAPGLIVYERLQSSFKGDGSDIMKNINLFVPDTLRDNISLFLNSFYNKESIDSITNGSIILVNWHMFLDKDKSKKDDKLDDLQKDIKRIFPITPGVSGGNSLDVLDTVNIDFMQELIKLDSLIVINDEAHHIHDEDILWQKSMNELNDTFGKGRFMQLDFSATPYTTTGSENKKIKHYFPHTIVDFGLLETLKNGLVKLIVLDELEEKNFEDDDYKAIRDSNNKIQLSEGQKTLLKVGLHKLDEVKISFKIYENKFPKMMVTVEDTKVVKKVEEYLQDKTSGLGLEDKEILVIHSNKEMISEKEYLALREKLFNIDNEDEIKVIVSVLMLKEGFDVNNICVVVPLRATKSSILLEQTIGRGLRLMFRKEKSHQERADRFKQIANKENGTIYFNEDVLHIVEHPAFKEFYKGLIGTGVVVPPRSGGGGGGNMIVSKLKPNYKQYDMFFIKKLPEMDIELDNISIDDIEIDINVLPSYTEYELEKLISMKDNNYKVVSKELTSLNIIGGEKNETDIPMYKEYKNYDDVLTSIVEDIIIKRNGLQDTSIQKIRKIRKKLRDILEDYISFKLFNKSFNPEDKDNFNIFGINTISLKEFIGNAFGVKIVEYLEKNSGVKYNITKRYFSEYDEFFVSENSHLELIKTIYTHTSYPSNRGGLEKEFLNKIDKDGNIESFIKIMEFKHDFATLSYINDNAMISKYYPDFMVKTKTHVYLVETKANKDVDEPTVLKKHKVAKEYVSKVNKLNAEDRDNKIWDYVILSENNVKSFDNFNGMIENAKQKNNNEDVIQE